MNINTNKTILTKMRRFRTKPYKRPKKIQVKIDSEIKAILDSYADYKRKKAIYE